MAKTALGEEVSAPDVALSCARWTDVPECLVAQAIAVCFPKRPAVTHTEPNLMSSQAASYIEVEDQPAGWSSDDIHKITWVLDCHGQESRNIILVHIREINEELWGILVSKEGA